MFRLLIYLLLLIYPVGNLFSQQVKIGLYTSIKPISVMFATDAGVFALKSSILDREITTVKSAFPVYLSYSDSGIVVKDQNQVLGTFPDLEFSSLLEGSLFKLLPLQPQAKEQWYEGGLAIRQGISFLRLINLVDLEKYVGGVVEAEAGREKFPEFYKIQATICRTFALSNLQKHSDQGFNLCDQVHCQVYRGRPNTQQIKSAVSSTENLVIVDRDLHLIDAVFHSNCGGQTHNSEDYWKDEVSYLRSVKDSFCLAGNQARWKLMIPKEKWLAYLQGAFKYDIENPNNVHNVCNYQAFERSEFLLDKDFKIGLRKIRSDWNLRSTFFSISAQGEEILFEGRGYGHGVGLCQEGAMARAKSGHNYAEILHHYFTNVYLVPKDVLGYLRGF